MNPLTSVKGTIISGFVLAILVAFYVSPDSSVFQTRNLSIWLHALFGVTWVGLLYYFNFVQVPAMADALADEGGPGPAAIGKYIAPRALLWFRMAAAAIRNQSSALGATYFPIAAGPGPPSSASASAIAGT